MENQRPQQGMKVTTFLQFASLTIALFIGVGVVLALAFRQSVMANWTANRCDPGVVAMANWFKPPDDQRSGMEFAEENWRYCQKEYVQNAIRTATTVPTRLANAQGDVVGVVQDMADTAGDVFFGLWKFVYQAYSTFMDQMKGAGKLFHNFMIQMHGLIERMQAAALSIVFGLLSLVAAYISSVQLVLIVAIVIIGILIALQIILFFLLLPISGLIITITALISVVVVAVATAIAAATVSELFTPGACFAPDVCVAYPGGNPPRHIRDVKIGDRLADGGIVTAVHRFFTADPLWLLRGVQVTGDHLVVHPEDSRRMIAVRDHPEAVEQPVGWLTRLRGGHELICLTTTTRRIPCLSPRELNVMTMFADWEEIPAGDTESLRAWYREVWASLNPGRPVVSVSDEVLKNSEAGLSPDCEVAVPGGDHRWIHEIRPGDTVLDASGLPTRVLGVVSMMGDQTSDAVVLGGTNQLVREATWIRLGGDDGWWGYPTHMTRRDLHPMRWWHLYTVAGTFRLRGGWCVRDASDVGMENLRPIVTDVVVGRTDLRVTI